MLDFMRKRKKSWLIMFLLFISVLVFVFFGLGAYMNQPQIEAVAKVNGEEISLREFQIHYQRMIEFYRDLFKGRLTPEEIQALNLRKVLLDELIERQLLLQEARRIGLDVTDEELADAIARIPEFQVNGRFDRDLYLRVLRLRRQTPAEFESEQRSQLVIERLLRIIQEAAHVSDNEAMDHYRMERQSLNLYFVGLPASDFLAQAQVTEEEIQEQYERNKEAFREPLQVQVEYLAYPYEKFSSKVQLTEKEIEDYYDTHKAERFHQPAAVRLRHILFRFPAGADIQQQGVIRLKAEGVLKRIRAGEDFAKLAREHSEDPSSAQGGDVGWFAPGQMLPALEKVVFSLKPGEVSELVESPAGLHILKAEQTREAKTKSLKEVREEVIQGLKLERGKIEAGRAADGDRDRVLSGTDLSQLAKERGLTLKGSPFFARSEVLPEVGPIEDFDKAAFSLGLEQISPVIEGPSAFYLLRVKQRKEPTIQDLTSVRSQLEKTLRDAKALELASQKATGLLEQMKNEKDMRKLAVEQGLRVQETGWFRRSAAEIPKIGVLQEVQGGNIPISLYRPIPDRVYSQKGVAYLIALKDSRPADMEAFDKEKVRIKGQLLEEKTQRILKRFIESLKAKARVIPNPSFIEPS